MIIFVVFKKVWGLPKINYAYHLHTTNSIFLLSFMCRGAIVSEIHEFNQKKEKKKKKKKKKKMMMMKNSENDHYIVHLLPIIENKSIFNQT